MIFTDDLGNPEGPVLLPDNSWLVTEMRLDRGWMITHLSADGQHREVLTKTGRPNGLTIDREGAIWVAESLTPALLRLTLDGHYVTVLTACHDKPFLFPNDLRFGPDGALYMTDSGIRFPEWARLDGEQRRHTHTDGRVYRIDTISRSIEIVDTGLPFANGIAFGPNNDLFISATISGLVYRYPWNRGDLGSREIFGNVLNPEFPDIFRGPDGMAFGTDGNLYVTVSRQGDVVVLNSEGDVVNRIRLDGPSPTNIAFGPRGTHMIFVTEQGIGQFERHQVTCDGLPLLR
jgi:gluconolactonase